MTNEISSEENRWQVMLASCVYDALEKANMSVESAAEVLSCPDLQERLDGDKPLTSTLCIRVCVICDCNLSVRLVPDNAAEDASAIKGVHALARRMLSTLPSTSAEWDLWCEVKMRLMWALSATHHELWDELIEIECA